VVNGSQPKPKPPMFSALLRVGDGTRLKVIIIIIIIIIMIITIAPVSRVSDIMDIMHCAQDLRCVVTLRLRYATNERFSGDTRRP
jgi:hypothetical protein